MLERMPKMGRALEIAGALALPLILYPLILLSLLSNALGAAKRALLGCVEEEAGASSSAATLPSRGAAPFGFHFSLRRLKYAMSY